MRPAHAIIAWTPVRETWSATCGQALVGQWVHRRAPHWALQYALLAGATSRVRRSMADGEALSALMADYVVLRSDGIKPDAINEAFSVIDGWLPP